MKTTHDNVFFTRTAVGEGERPESIWTVPDEIASVVAEMDWPALEEQAARDKEVARLQKEIGASTGLKRSAPDESTGTSVLQEAEEPKPKKKKRRAQAAETVDLGDQAIGEISISAPANEAEVAVDEEPVDEAEDDGDDDDNDAFSTSSAEEAWQREMAEGLSKLAEEEAAAAAAGISVEEARAKAKREQEEKEDKEDQEAREEEEKKKDDFGRDFKVPAQVNLSPEEARTLFKVCLYPHIFQVVHHSIMAHSYRRYCLKRTHRRLLLSPPSCPYSSPTHVMFCFRRKLSVKPLSTSGAATKPAKNDSPRLLHLHQQARRLSHPKPPPTSPRPLSRKRT